MQIDFTTFVLELVNFAVLVWILNRFLYKPVQAVMMRRRAAIEKTVQDANAQKIESEGLRARYAMQLADWGKEQDRSRAELNKELIIAREKGLEEVRLATEKETRRLATANAKKDADALRQLEKRALAQGVGFAAKFLERLAGPELDRKLAELFMHDMQDWPNEQVTTLAAAAQEATGKIGVESAHELPTITQIELTKTLSDKLGEKCQPEFSVNEKLITGLRVTIGPWVLQADAADELAFFTGEIGYDS